MDTANIVNSLGLFLDIVGVCLIFWFGLPKWIPRDGEPLIIDGGTAGEDPKPKPDRYTLGNRIGLGLLICGFILQLVSNFIPASR